ncbi:hypothetical protein ER308_11595 [Egibacter rhizosphaerae]|uniref:Uncharacterized protein n=1 Tax=Egibacter rhizosphaerae TaxID=1670831 RepID=A0A411YGD2_9ACTN|nr:hypothetical protein [Egibacter rhizosphaerae]QBI20142.1 hypothetical protein ER308_11595 [Egibacter rhizosphaerae]
MAVANTRRVGALATFACGAVLAAGLGGCEDEQAWRTYTADDGLAHDAVESVEIGPGGVVWAGTHAGVSRFDDQEWTTLSHQQAAPIGSRADQVAVGPDGGAWVASWEGVASFDGQRWSAHGEADGLPDWPVTAVAVTDDEEVLAASESVYRFDGRRSLDSAPSHRGHFSLSLPGAGLGQSRSGRQEAMSRCSAVSCSDASASRLRMRRASLRNIPMASTVSAPWQARTRGRSEVDCRAGAPAGGRGS